MRHLPSVLSPGISRGKIKIFLFFFFSKRQTFLDLILFYFVLCISYLVMLFGVMSKKLKILLLHSLLGSWHVRLRVESRFDFLF